MKVFHRFYSTPVKQKKEQFQGEADYSKRIKPKEEIKDGL